MPSAEGLLAVALVAVYVIDSTHFLRIGEALVRTRRQTLDALSFGWSFELGGRRPYIPNPLTPFRPDFRIEWDTAGEATVDARRGCQEMRRHLEIIRPLGWLAPACAIPIVLVAPVALAMGEQIVFLAAAATGWLGAFAGCTFVVLRKRALGLSAWQVCSLVFVALVCLPCSGNLARAVTLQHRWTFAARDLPLLGSDARSSAEIRHQALVALMSAKRYVAEESQEFRVIDEQIRQLEACNS